MRRESENERGGVDRIGKIKVRREVGRIVTDVA